MSNMSNEEIVKVIGKNVKRYRNLRGYTQDKLAEEAGIDRTAISKLETGKLFPNITFLMAICRTLEIEIIYLFEEDKVLKD